MNGYDMWIKDRQEAEVLSCGLKVKKEVQPTTGKLILKMWKPKATKPFAHYSFKTTEQMEDFIIKKVRLFYSHQESKAQYKKERAGTPEMLAQVKEGMIFMASWGYDQTNIDFYQVVRVTGQSAVIREIGQFTPQNSTSHSWDSAHTLPSKDKFTSAEMTKRIQFWGKAPHFRIASYAVASLWDGKAKQYSWGH